MNCVKERRKHLNREETFNDTCISTYFVQYVPGTEYVLRIYYSTVVFFLLVRYSTHTLRTKSQTGVTEPFGSDLKRLPPGTCTYLPVAKGHKVHSANES